MNIKTVIASILVVVLSSAFASAKTVTVPARVANEPYVASFTNEATGYFENSGVSMQFSPFIGFASGSLETGFQVIEIVSPSAGVTPIETDNSVYWPGLFAFPSGATGTWRYTTGAVSLQKDLLLSGIASNALPSPTDTGFFPGCVSPWLVVGDIDFQLTLGDARLYADGVEFSINDAVYGREIEVRSAEGDLYFTLQTPFVEKSNGDIANGWLYYDGAEGVILYCFDFGSWPDGVRFDPTITTSSQSYIQDAYQQFLSSDTLSNASTLHVGKYSDVANTTYRTFLSINPSFITDSGYNLDEIYISNIVVTLPINTAGATAPEIVIYAGANEIDEAQGTDTNRLATAGLLIDTYISANVAGSTDTVSSASMAAQLRTYISEGGTAWKKGFILASGNENQAGLYDRVVYHSSEATVPILTVSIEFINTSALIFSDNCAALDGPNIVFYSSDLGNFPEYIDGSFNSYYTWNWSGDPIACATLAYVTNTSILGNSAIVMASIPAAHRGSALIAIASTPYMVKPATTILGINTGGMTLSEFWADSRSTTKPEILAMVKSASDQTILSHATTDAYVTATYNQIDKAREQIASVTAVSLPSLHRDLIASMISWATQAPYKARTAILLTTVENTSDPTVTGDPLRPWGYPGDIVASENHYRDVAGATHTVVSVIGYDNNLGVGQTLYTTNYETLETWNAACATPLTVGVSITIKPWADNASD